MYISGTRLQYNSIKYTFETIGTIKVNTNLVHKYQVYTTECMIKNNAVEPDSRALPILTRGEVCPGCRLS